MTQQLHNITSQLRGELAPVLEDTLPQTREILGERTQVFQGSVVNMEDFSKHVTCGLQQIKLMQIAVEADALDKILKMNFSGLPGLEALVKSNLMQHHCGINHSQMLLIFERACNDFEKGDVDMALGIFIALLFLNPLVAPLWYCVARAFETKKNLPQSLFSYAMCDLLSRGNMYSALDATECLVAAGKKRLAKTLLAEINYDLSSSKKFPAELRERAEKLGKAVDLLP